MWLGLIRSMNTALQRRHDLWIAVTRATFLTYEQRITYTYQHALLARPA
jgi:hypothetical protein